MYGWMPNRVRFDVAVLCEKHDYRNKNYDGAPGAKGCTQPMKPFPVIQDNQKPFYSFGSYQEPPLKPLCLYQLTRQEKCILKI
jgi:hypothetical protein